MNLDSDTHLVEDVVFGPKTRIQSVQTSDRILEQGFRFNLGVLHSKVVHIFHDAVALEY